jgi:hypothetical protein
MLTLAAVVVVPFVALSISAAVVTIKATPRLLQRESNALTETCFNTYPSKQRPEINEPFLINSNLVCPVVQSPSRINGQQSTATPPTVAQSQAGTSHAPMSPPPTKIIDIGSGAFIKVDLSGPPGIKIESLYDAQQPLLPGKSNIWSWRVTATEPGQWELTIVVRAYDTTGKKLVAENPTIPFNVLPHEPSGHKLSRWWHTLITFASDLNGLTASLSGTLGLITGFTIGKRRPKKSVPTEPGEADGGDKIEAASQGNERP